MLREPVGGQPSDGVERARLGEKVVGAVFAVWQVMRVPTLKALQR